MAEEIEFIVQRTDKGFVGKAKKHNIELFGFTTTQLVNNIRTACKLHFARPVNVKCEYVG